VRRMTRTVREASKAAATLSLLVVIGVLAGSPTSGAQSAPPPATSTAAALKAASWSSNVSVSVSAGAASVVITSDGIPSTTYWSLPSEYAVPDAGVVVPTAKTAHITPDPTAADPLSVTVPAVATWSSTTTPTTGGPIGLLLSGAPLFNPYEGDGTTVALSSNFYLKNTQGAKVYFVDACNGHPTPMGAYHYHGLPTCITGKVDGSTGPSHLLGVALDGYPIYGDRDVNGKLVKSSKLDACDGIFSATPEFPHGIYHYVLPNTKAARSSLRCYHGVVSQIHTSFAGARYICGRSPDGAALTATGATPAPATEQRRAPQPPSHRSS
jgi:hypothetical protein